MAAIIALTTRPDRLRRDQAEALRQALLPLADQMPDAVRAIVAHIDRQTASKSRWTFIMLSPEQNDAVVSYLATTSTRPLVAVRLWALCFRHLHRDSGEIMLRREDLAAALGETPDHISAIMSELVAFGAISRTREAVPGLKGRGMVSYFMNPKVATGLTGATRDEAQEEAPALAKGKPKAARSRKVGGLTVIPGGRA